VTTRQRRWLWGPLLLAAALARGGEAEQGKVEFPNLRLDLKAKTIEIDGVFCNGQYHLELLLCRGTLRDYEALVSTSCKPSVLHAALLAIGLKPRVRDKEEPTKTVREGDGVDILIRYEKDGKPVTVPATALMAEAVPVKGQENPTLRPVQSAPFVFTGSLLYPDHKDKSRMLYLGDVEEWLVGCLGDLPSVVDIEDGKTWKYGSLEINRKAAPPKGTKATVIFRPRPKEKDAAK